MSYRPSQNWQLSIFDRSLRLTEHEIKCLEKSWTKVFSDEIFPAIDEDRFRVLYSKTASRPNTPVNDGISPRIKRMGSLMLEANIRNLRHIELLYTCVARLVRYHHKNQTGADLAGLEHYLALDDRNRVIYHSKSTSLQNPTDLEATYSRKTWKQYIGYAANIVETVGSDDSVVVDCQ